jgi:hypothetical protein
MSQSNSVWIVISAMEKDSTSLPALQPKVGHFSGSGWHEPLMALPPPRRS